MRRWLSVGLTILAVLLGTPACSIGPAPIRLEYSVGECDEGIPFEQLSDWASLQFIGNEGSILVFQNIAYTCCADIHVTMEREGALIKLVETNEGEVCRCMCGYEARLMVKGLPPGIYHVQVWGIQHPDAEPLELLGEAEVKL